jgi:hypothetical protein
MQLLVEALEAVAREADLTFDPSELAACVVDVLCAKVAAEVKASGSYLVMESRERSGVEVLLGRCIESDRAQARYVFSRSWGVTPRVF